MKNLHVIPTDKPSRLQLNVNTKKLILFDNIQSNNESVHLTTQHLYITNDEEIKEGDWFLDDNNSIGQSYKLSHVQFANPKKIILTTDFDKQPRVQAIDDEFLEWFVKNPSCEEVETIIVSTWCNDGKVCVCNVPKFCNEKRNDFKYKIIIPKEEQKELRRKLFTLIKSLEQEEPKQDPLEQAAKEYAEMHLDVSGTLGKYLVKAVFQDGVKWQAERMYSEEDMAESFIACWTANVPEGIECKLSFKEWFEQFKTK